MIRAFFHRSLSRVKRHSPLTFRGFALLASAGYLLLGPARLHTDLVASVIGVSIVALALPLFLGVVFFRIHLKEKGLWQVLLPTGFSQESSRLISNSPIRIVIKSPPLRLLPFFEIHAQLQFLEESAPLCLTHRISGGPSPRSYTLPENLQFPHRGRWHPGSLTFTSRDVFGLFALRWNLSLEHILPPVEIMPPDFRESPFPLVRAVHRAGDTLPDLHHRQGDYYDLKPYQEGDNVNRIIWKVYARTRELYARQPERSITPEGTVAVFALASGKDDHGASIALSYLAALEQADLEVFFSCRGAQAGQIVNSHEEAVQLLIDSVWNIKEQQDLAAVIDDFVNSVRGHLGGASLTSIVFIGAVSDFNDHTVKTTLATQGVRLSESGVKPIVFAGTRRASQRKNASSATSSALAKRAASYLVHTSEDALEEIRHTDSFLTEARAKNWEVHEHLVIDVTRPSSTGGAL